MIRTITVYTGDSDCAKAAQQHAIALAKHVSARLKVVGLYNESDDMHETGAEAAIDLVQQKRDTLVKEAERAGVKVATGLHDNGLTRGLLQEARETDVLVLGLPTEADMQSDDAAAHLVRKERPVLRKAQCALLLVNQPPKPINKILACYSKEPVAQRMLQMIGYMAEGYKARVGVFTISQDPTDATEVAVSAEEYLKGFDIPAIETMPKSGSTSSKVTILQIAELFEADLIGMGEEGHNWLERFMCANLAERTAMATCVPLLIVR